MDDKNVIKILVPGMFSPGAVYKNMQSSIVAHGYICYALTFPYQDRDDYYNFEHSDLATFGFRDKIEWAAKRILEIVGEHQMDFDLVGHSAGGLIVLKLASLPEISPRKIFLLATAGPFFVFGLYPSVVKSFLRIITTQYFWKRKIKMTYDKVSYSMLNKIPEDERGEIYDLLVEESGQFIFEVGLYFLDFRKRSTLVRYSKIGCPVVMFVGTDDNITPIYISKDVRKEINYRVFAKNVLIFLKQLFGSDQEYLEFVKLIVLPEKGHWLPVEAKEEILREIFK